MKTKSLLSILVVSLVLIGGVGIALWGGYSRDVEAKYPELLSRLPKEVGGWEVKDLPIASSPEMQKAVDEMLNYDQAVFRTYSRQGMELSVYAAYWRPYRFHPRLISIHTPDVCWVGNGFVLKEADYNYPVQLLDGLAWHAQWRVFEAADVPIYVIYWHLIDGKLSGYAEGPGSSNRSFFDGLLSDLRHGAGEQFFIRLSSPQPWSQWNDEEIYHQILETFSPVLKSHNR